MVLFVLPSDPATAGLDPDALVDGVVAAVQEGRIPVAQIEADALKLLELRRSLGPEE
jgi:beta-N-acetylhexosaminidase